MKNIVKTAWILFGFICLGLGTIGVVLPILPTVPFYLATVFCFAKSSKRLHEWFTASKLYEKHLASYVETRAMTRKTKISIMSMASAMMLLGFLMMGNVPIGRICVAIVWIFHVYYFVRRIKTISPKEVEE